jgi:hypothetical protein
MVITKKAIADRIAAYLRHELALAALVDWAEEQLMDGDFDETDEATIARVLARLGVADTRAFGLTWENCEQLLNDLGFAAKVEVVAA